VESFIEAGTATRNHLELATSASFLARSSPYAMPVTILLRNHRLALYGAFSSGLVAAVVLNALQNHSNFFAAAFAMSQSNGSVMVSDICDLCDGTTAVRRC
jgi:hypothetical protein